MTAKQAKKRGLGRGLDALFQDGEAAHYKDFKTEMQAPVSDASQAQRSLPVSELKPGAFQPRRKFTAETIEQLADSIAAHGVLQPLLVRPLKDGIFEIIAGERRWRAAQKAQLHDVPVVIQDMTDQEALEIGLIENLQRQDLTPIEEADGYQRLMREFKHTQEDLARQLGKSRSHIANMLRLLKLPTTVQELVQDEKPSIGHARALVTLDNPLELALSVIKEGLSVRELEKRTAKGKTQAVLGSAKTKITTKDVDTLALEADLTRTVGLNVLINNQGKAGQLVIEYKNLDQLDELIARLSA